VPLLNAAPEDYEGKRIAEIYFEPAEQPLTRDQLGLALQIRPPDVFDARRVSQAIERLYASGRFATIEVDASLNSAGGVVLAFRTTPSFFISRVTVDRIPEPPNREQLESATRLELGEPYDDSMLPEAASQLTALLRGNGFYSPKITWETARRDSTEEVDVRFHVDPGARARFATPVFQGRLEYTPQKLIKTTNWLKWWGYRGYKPFSEPLLGKGIERLRGLYLEHDNLQARIAVDRLQYDRDANVVNPHLAIDAGPRTFVRADGVKISRGTLRKLVPVYQERTIDRELLVEGQQNLVEYFQSEGYFDAQVTFDQLQPNDQGEQTILYRVARGSRSRLTQLRIEGNRYFDTQTIRERMSIIPATRIRYRRGVYSRTMLENDKQAVADLYHSNGFRDVKVTAQVGPVQKGKTGDIEVVVQIEEGPQWTVSALELSGVDLRIYPDVYALLSSTPGQPFGSTKMLEDRDAVLGYYFNNGYPEASFDFQATAEEGAYRMKLRYTVVEGRRNFVREVLVRGLGRTNPEIVNRRIRLNPLDPLSQAQIVDSQRRLYDLGIFAKVDVAIQNPDGRERNKYVLFQLEEASRYSVNFGFGAELTRIGGDPNSLTAPVGNPGFSPRVSLGITRLNMFNLGHTAGIQTRFSRIQQRAILSYFAPQFRGDERFNLTFSMLGDISRDVNTFTSRRLEAALQLGQHLSRSDTLQYRFIYRLVGVDKASLKIDPVLIPIFSQPVRVGVLSGSWLRDRRDDPVDSTRGMFTSIDFGGASKVFGSQTDYTRSVIRNSSYYRVGRDMILARTLTLGALHSFNPILEPIPLPEKFFGGGASTHRGFPENQAGPRDPVTGYPIGGDAFLFFGTELRYPILGRSLGGVLFWDAGNVYSHFDTISFRYHQNNPEDFDYMVHAFGLGLRYKTPIGPVRFDVAFAPNSPQFLGYSGTRDELLQGIPKPIVLQRVGRFQIHFSLGQTF